METSDKTEGKDDVYVKKDRRRKRIRIDDPLVNRLVRLFEEYFQISQSKFAENAGIPSGNFSLMLSGAMAISGAVIEKICNRYSVSKKWLIEGVGNVLEPQEEIKDGVRTVYYGPKGDNEANQELNLRKVLDLTKTIIEKDSVIAQKDEIIARKIETIAEKDALIAVLDEEILNLKSALTEKNELLHKLTCHIPDISKKVDYIIDKLNYLAVREPHMEYDTNTNRKHAIINVPISGSSEDGYAEGMMAADAAYSYGAPRQFVDGDGGDTPSSKRQND